MIDAKIPVPTDNPVNGMIINKLGFKKGSGPCAFMYEVRLPNGTVVCTHGPDPAPPSVDVRKRRPPAVSAQKPAQKGPAVAGVFCDGDGVSGKRVQALYVRAEDHEDNYDGYLGSYAILLD